MENITTSEKSKSPVSTEKIKKFKHVKNGVVKPESERQMKSRIMGRLMRQSTPLLMELDKSLLKRPVFKKVLNENTKHGFKGRYPALRINYPDLILSKGNLPNPDDLSVSSPKPGKLVFSWTDNSGILESLPSDLLFVGLFDRKSRCWIVSIHAAERSACRYSLNASPFQGKPVQIYAGFISEDSERMSTSLYLGEIRVA
jgi:Family of unknown function (DUF6266)